MKKLSILLVVCLFACGCGSRARLLWKFKTGAAVYGSPAMAAGNVIIASTDHYLYAFDPQTGKVAWKQNLLDKVMSSPYVRGSVIYIGGHSGHFYALNSKDGTILWKLKIDRPIYYQACGDDTGLYFGDNGGYFQKVDLNGKPLWSIKAGDQVWGHCEFYKNTVMTTSWDSYLYGIDRNTGQVLWKVSSGKHNYGAPTLSGNLAFFGSHEYVFAVDAETGKLLHKTKTTYVDHATLFDGFLWTTDGGLVKRSCRDTGIIQRMKFTASPYEPGVGKNCIIVNADGTWLFAISSNMKILWKFKGGEEFYRPGIFHNEVYYVGNRDSYVYAIIPPR